MRIPTRDELIRELGAEVERYVAMMRGLGAPASGEVALHVTYDGWTLHAGSDDGDPRRDVEIWAAAPTPVETTPEAIAAVADALLWSVRERLERGPSPAPGEARELYHLTLSTGHGRLSPRHEVRSDVVARLMPLVGPDVPGSLAGGVIPGTGGWRLTVYRPTAGVYGYEIEADGAGLIAMCYMGTPGHHRAAWEYLRGSATAGRLERPASDYWLAVALHEGASRIPRADLEMLGDLERCIAWAILDSARAQSN